MAGDQGTFTDLKSILNSWQQIKDSLADFQIIKVVLGNVTCDLDSFACSMAYAAFSYVKNASKAIPTFEEVTVPILNIDKADMILKTEVCYVLEQLKIPLNLILFRNDINLADLASQNKLRLVLVDHHVLQPKDQALENCVVEVIDHRPQVYEWPLPPSLCTFKPVGSCATLVSISIDPAFLQSCTDVTQILYCAILLDTMNFSAVSKRFTQLDVDVLSKLEPIVLKENETRLKLYHKLLNARVCITDFTAYDLLKKDVKIGNNIPVCTLPMLVQAFGLRTDVEGALQDLIAKGNHEMVVLIGVSFSGGVMTRDIGFYTVNHEEFCSTMVATLETSPDLNLSLVQIASPILGLNIYMQLNMERTRKHILPIIEETATKLREENKEH